MNIAIIPARGGSKRIPKKNIRSFSGKPIISYSIETAKKSELFDRIIVSTDCPEIAKVSEDWGAEVPFYRPETLSDDYTGTNDVVAHVLSQLGVQCQISFACCIYATSPFLLPEDLQKGLNLLEDTDRQFAFSVCNFPSPIFRSFRVLENDGLEMFWPEHLQTRSQDLPDAYFDAGQFYWGRPEAFIEGVPLYGKDSLGVRLPRYRVQDIDTEEDWVNAELMYEVLKQKLIR